IGDAGKRSANLIFEVPGTLDQAWHYPKSAWAALRQLEGAAGYGLDGLQIEARLDVGDPRLQRLGRVAGQHRDSALRHDRAVVVLLVHHVDGDAAFTRARGDHRLVDAAPVHPLPA